MNTYKAKVNHDLHVLTIKNTGGGGYYGNGCEVHLDDFKLKCVHKVNVEIEENEFYKVTLVFTPSRIIYSDDLEEDTK